MMRFSSGTAVHDYARSDVTNRKRRILGPRRGPAQASL